MLDEGRIDLAAGVLRGLPKRFGSEQIGIDRSVCISRRDHPALVHGLDLETFLGLPHARYSLDIGEEVDQALANLNRRRRIKLSSPSFYPIVLAVEYSDMLAVVPAGVAQALALHESISIHDMPLDVPKWPTVIAWTAAGEQDPGIRWLRDFFVRLYRGTAPELA
jgi:DNA-binding transcriptional LysR family regulator